MKNLTLSELKAKVTLAEYQSTAVQYSVKLCEEINAAGVPCELSFECEDSDGKLYYRSYNIQLLNTSNGAIIFINKRDTDKQFSLWLGNRYEFCDESEQTEVKEKYFTEQPNKIGVITAAKVAQWVDYLQANHRAFSDRNIENCKKIDLFKIQFNGFVTSCPDLVATNYRDRGNYYYIHEGGKRGYIVRNGLEYNFEITPGRGFISNKISVRAGNTLAEFIQLSSNNIKQAPKNNETILNNNERVFMVTWSLANHVFCNLKDLSSVVKSNSLAAGYYTIYHFWNNKPKKATKKLIKDMHEAARLPMDFFM